MAVVVQACTHAACSAVVDERLLLAVRCGMSSVILSADLNHAQVNLSLWFHPRVGVMYYDADTGSVLPGLAASAA